LKAGPPEPACRVGTTGRGAEIKKTKRETHSIDNHGERTETLRGGKETELMTWETRSSCGGAVRINLVKGFNARPADANRRSSPEREKKAPQELQSVNGSEPGKFLGKYDGGACPPTIKEKPLTTSVSGKRGGGGGSFTLPTKPFEQA